MVISRAIANTARCNACQLAVLRSFTSISTLAARSTSTPNTIVHPAQYQARRISACQSRRSSRVEQKRPFTGQSSSERDGPDPIAEDSPKTSTTATPTPWYLQVETPQQAPSPLSERQRLPDLPEDAPVILQPMLEYVSVDLGIDDLTLFDLRNLDPPPALGANLVMIIGTARSEKHLHVSADRLCRWLRSNHKLTPFADGLLGRNELKLKMRRKARRARMLGSVGASETSNADDGVRTGWVCVNAGRVDEQKTAVKDTVPKGVVGFGTASTGTRVVVQMLTEDKRGELNLEGLWQGALDRQTRKEAKDQELIKEQEAQEANYDQDTVPQLEPDVAGEVVHRSTIPSAESRRVFNPFQRTRSRSFSTISRLLQSHAASLHASKVDGANIDTVEPRIVSPAEGNSSIPESVWPFEGMGSSQQKDNIPADFTHAAKTMKLHVLLNHLEALPQSDALEVLGNDAHDTNSSSFLQSFYQSVPSFPESSDWDCRVSLFCRAIQLGHPGYPKSSLFSVFHEMQLSGVDVSEATFHKIIQALLSRNVSNTVKTISDEELDMALTVLDDMSHRGLLILTEEIFLQLEEATSFLVPIEVERDPESTQTFKSSSLEDHPNSNEFAELDVPPPSSTETYYTVSLADFERQQKLRRRLAEVRTAFNIEYTQPESQIRVLQLAANQADWATFWDTWHHIARRMQPRSASLYAFLFQTVALTRNQQACTRTLEAWVPGIARERPRVALRGEVAAGVRDCLAVAYPSVEDDVKSGVATDDRLVKLWRACEQGMKVKEVQEWVNEVD
ncbi:hypothetical protein L228DRAFT_260033 [Xylona heveae TC161]|uniref:ATPase synthesis protein 25 n=1 Tax=Xylona heveae (strain CBS 132557 / TC161) TaxID=1328760 RepID=A0A165H9F4_XYLHT|nr:hypothetical protein L228DRAFT_260033 [Xylona heveae TC161]KZF23171.1 hypothetical protein L228DRAFT_260033 [Xylona heveae TC161]